MAGAVVGAVVIAGSLGFDENFLATIGLVPWWGLVVVVVSQSMVSFAFVGIVGWSLVADWLQTDRSKSTDRP